MQLTNHWKVVPIQAKGYKFLITEKPYDQTMKSYIETLNEFRVNCVVRVCKPTYNTDMMLKAGIPVYDLEYEDGMYPPGHIVEDWFEIVKEHRKMDPDGCIAVHCVGGLGRAPVMVALSLIELGLKYEDVVEMIRAKQRGAINTKQLRYLEKYRPSGHLKRKSLFCCIQ